MCIVAIFQTGNYLRRFYWFWKTLIVIVICVVARQAGCRSFFSHPIDDMPSTLTLLRQGFKRMKTKGNVCTTLRNLSVNDWPFETGHSTIKGTILVYTKIAEAQRETHLDKSQQCNHTTCHPTSFDTNDSPSGECGMSVWICCCSTGAYQTITYFQFLNLVAANMFESAVRNVVIAFRLVETVKRPWLCRSVLITQCARVERTPKFAFVSVVYLIEMGGWFLYGRKFFRQKIELKINWHNVFSAIRLQQGFLH